MQDDTTTTEGAGEAAAESRRGRVRRLLIDPLNAAGFRKPGNVPADRHAADLSAICDHVAYLDDHQLDVLRQMLLPKGQGKDRNGWPSRATVIALAEGIAPRPVEELPGLLRWFRSVAGPRARDEGTLVETYHFFRRYKRPPQMGAHHIRDRARDNRDKLRVIEDRMRRGAATDAEAEWARRYRDCEAYCEGLVAEGEAAREDKGAA